MMHEDIESGQTGDGRSATPRRNRLHQFDLLEKSLAGGLAYAGDGCHFVEPDCLLHRFEVGRTVFALFEVHPNLPACWRVDLLIEVFTDEEVCVFTLHL